MDNKVIYAIDGYNLCGNIIEYQVVKETEKQYIATCCEKIYDCMFIHKRRVNKATMSVGSLRFEETKELAKAKQIDLLMLRVARNKKSIEDAQNQNLKYEKKIKELTEVISNGY